MWAASSFNPKKAPGNDGLTADICAAAIKLNPTLFLAVANKCLELAHFPGKWKEAAVVVLRKPGKEDYTHPKSYRPIGLLPVLGKIFEKMTIRRIKWHIVPKISKNQYGFMPQRSTEDSLYEMMQHIKAKIKSKKLVLLVSLDIEGAFDNAWWPAVRCALAKTGCPINLRRLIDSYLKDRSVCVKYSGAEWVKKTSKGCVQGSIGGPIFWNLLLDPLLQELNDKGEHCQAFADDVVLIFSGDKALDVQERANAALAHVRRWGVKNKLKFAPQKTKAMIITNKIKYDSPLLKMGGESIGLSKEIKILGLTVDDGLTFNAHVKNVCCKVQNLYRQLCRAAKIHWGLNSEIVRTIYIAVIEPIILYAASAWVPASNKLMTKKQLDIVQRGFVQKIVKAYKTVSLHSALLLAGLLPLDLRVREAASLYEIRLSSLDEWNQRYKEGETASNTKIFFPDAIEAYHIIRKLDIDPEIVQVITGHGGFSEYLYRFKCKESPACACDPEREETIMHLLTECPIYSRQRIDLELEIGIKISKDNVHKIISNKHVSNKFLKYCKNIAHKVKNKNKS
ncbi:unnamed protein product [Parnassius mnemosyne]|uniref:Reverse transcriptase domain-containing protein n=1 Tax=Parnassius mnemosyne TaxID=213953 RepID=A0AAV1KPM8_9NEOP